MDVSVIGGGPCGFSVAKLLAAAGLRVQIIEKQRGPGGVWHYTGKGPMYKFLETNVPTQVMQFSNRPFPPGTPTFCDRTTVYKYIEEFSSSVDVPVHYNTTIVRATKPEKGHHKGQWLLENTQGDSWASKYLVLAAGHYDVPFYPQVVNLDRVRHRFPDRVTHARYFDTPEPFRNKKVVVVGNANSGTDIAVQLLTVGAQVSLSRRPDSKEKPTDRILESFVTYKPEIREIGDDLQISYADGTAGAADAVIFCTGYRYEFPYLEDFSHSQKLPFLDPEGETLFNIYKDTFFIGDSSLAVVGMNKQIVPFPYSECQGAAIASLWSGKLSLPSQETMLREEAEKVADRGTGSRSLCIGWPKDFTLMKDLSDWAAAGHPDPIRVELWSPAQQELRSQTAMLRVEELEHKLDKIRQS